MGRGSEEEEAEEEEEDGGRRMEGPKWESTFSYAGVPLQSPTKRLQLQRIEESTKKGTNGSKTCLAMRSASMMGML